MNKLVFKAVSNITEYHANHIYFFEYVEWLVLIVFFPSSISRVCSHICESEMSILAALFIDFFPVFVKQTNSTQKKLMIDLTVQCTADSDWAEFSSFYPNDWQVKHQLRRITLVKTHDLIASSHDLFGSFHCLHLVCVSLHNVGEISDYRFAYSRTGKHQQHKHVFIYLFRFFFKFSNVYTALMSILLPSKRFIYSKFVF